MVTKNGASAVPSIVPGSTVWTNRTVELVKLGHMFVVQKAFTGYAVGSTINFLIDLSAVDAEFLVLYEIKYGVTQGKGIATFYEKGDYAGGTIVPIFNRNENSSQVAKTVFTIAPSGTTPGAEGQSYIAGGEAQGNSLSGGTSSDSLEVPTEVNTSFSRLFRIVHSEGSGNFDLNLRILFAEIPAP